MKVQLEKETKWNGETWYSIMKYQEGKTHGEYITGSANLERIVDLYDKIKNDPDFFATKKEILNSHEISVPLSQTNI